jgi:HupE / UreJ protein
VRARPISLPRLLVAALAAIAASLALVAGAGAHAMPTTAVLLDIGKQSVSGEIQMPLDRLAFARGQTITAQQAAGRQRLALESYTAQHVSAAGTDGRRWTVRFGRSTVQTISGAPAFVVPVTLTPPDGTEVSDFRLTYDVIIEQLVTHQALLSVRTDFRGGIVSQQDAKPIGVFDRTTRTLTVPAAGGSWLRGVVAAAGLGVDHVSAGSDHLLFLLMLLLCAPLGAVGGHWQRSASDRRSIVRVIHVVTAFAIGHSTTLVLAGLGVVDLPTRPVETLIAASIAVSALHAIKPLVARGEVLIAVTFGLVHGLGFASALDDLGLAHGTLVSTLFGFNIGIELTQLLVVALCMPSLLILVRTRLYAPVRITIASLGLVFATSWMLERGGATGTDPFMSYTEWAVHHPFAIAAALALLALVGRTLAFEHRQPLPVPTSR